MKAKKISFETEIKTTPSSAIGSQLQQPNYDVRDSSILRRMPHILCYPRNNAIELSAKVSKEINIDKTRIIELGVRTGRNDIMNAQLTLKAASAGLRLRTADAIVVGEQGTLSKSKTVGALELSSIAPESTIVIQVPYDLESNPRQISIGIDLVYTTANGRFQYTSNRTIVTELALDVSVHDVFRSDLLFSRFQIRASREVPLQLTAIDLSDSDKYSVETPPCKITPMLILPKQDGTILYKVQPKAGQNLRRQSVKDEKPLMLKVNYIPISEIVIIAAEQSLLADLADSEHMRLLVHTLTQPLQHLSPEKLEEVAVLNELHLPNFESMGWTEVLDCLKPDVRTKLRALLKNWHNENQIIPLPNIADIPQSAIHTINIAVPLPRMNVVHTASLVLPGNSTLVSQGALVPATISITHTRRWNSPSTIASVTTASAEAPLDFILEVDGPADTWLIGGQRRTRFSASEGETKTFSIMLIPLRTGRLLMPTVDVRILGKAAEDLRCETDYRSLAQTVVVVADVKSTTIGLNEVGGGTEVVLMGSEGRTLV